MALLELQQLRVSFGSVVAVKDISFHLQEQTLLGIVGPNGAGKSTLFNLISGDLRCSKGKIIWEQQDITAWPPDRRCRAGIGRCYQIPQPFTGLSVFENLLVAAMAGGALIGEEATTHALQVLELVGMIDRANTSASKLTLLERKRLELARALATRPRLLLLDEIAGGLTTAECEGLVTTIAHILETKVAVIWIEHVLQALLRLAQQLIVLNFGEVLAEGEAQKVLNDPRVREAYMGIPQGE